MLHWIDCPRGVRRKSYSHRSLPVPGETPGAPSSTNGWRETVLHSALQWPPLQGGTRRQSCRQNQPTTSSELQAGSRALVRVQRKQLLEKDQAARLRSAGGAFRTGPFCTDTEGSLSHQASRHAAPLLSTPPPPLTSVPGPASGRRA